MPVSLRYIRVHELETFVQSEEYPGLEFLPISRLRAISHARNPRAAKDDVALILAYDSDRLVAYLGLLPDKIFHHGKAQKICWFSCLYVLPEYRRSGLAMQLADEAFELYRGYVCISNYHPPSKAAFLKTGKYEETKVLQGVRSYMRSDLEQILVTRKQSLKGIALPLRTVDFLLNGVAWIKGRIRKIPASHLDFHLVDSLNEKEIPSGLPREPLSPFRRSAIELQWIVENPWVSSDPGYREESAKYYFSLYSPGFKQRLFLIRDNGGRNLGYMLLTLHRNQLRIPVIDILPGIEEEIFFFIVQLMRSEKIATLVCHDNRLVPVIQMHKRFFLHQRHSVYGFMASREVSEFMEGDFGTPSEGDGDGSFT